MFSRISLVILIIMLFMFNFVFSNSVSDIDRYYTKGEGEIPADFDKIFLKHQKTLQESNLDLHPNVYKEIIKRSQDTKYSEVQRRDYERAIREVREPLVLNSVLDTQESAAFMQGLNSCGSSGFLGRIGCILQPRVNENNLIKKESIRMLDKVYGEYNKELNSKKCKENRNACPSVEDYNNLIENEVSNFLARCDEKSQKCNELAIKLREELEPQKKIETNALFDIVAAITQPDYNALKAAKLFGIESDFNNVPQFLKESIPSQICLAKIEGYLDKERDDGQGVTKYGCPQVSDPKYDYDRRILYNGGNPNCLQVLADLRAQRTRTTPDGRTSISYSYYIKGPEYGEVSYLLAVSYIDSGNSKKQSITEIKKLGNGSTAKGYEQISLPLNSSIDVDEESFQIGLISVFEDKSPYIILTYPIVFIEDGDYYFELDQDEGNLRGNSLALRQKNSQAESLNTQDLLQLFN